MCREETPREKRMRRWLFASQGEWPQEKPCLASTLTLDFQLQNSEKIIICCLSHAVPAVWLQQFKLRHATTTTLWFHQLCLCLWEILAKGKCLPFIVNFRMEVGRIKNKMCRLLSWSFFFLLYPQQTGFYFFYIEWYNIFHYIVSNFKMYLNIIELICPDIIIKTSFY